MDAHNADMNKRYAAHKAKHGVGYGVGRERSPDDGKKWRTCEQCGEQYFAWGERFCSADCFGMSIRTVLSKSSALVLWVKPQRAVRVESDLSRGWTFVSGACAWCGGQFTVVHQLQSRYCSKRCLVHACERRSGRFRVPDRVRLSVYERDGWLCQLCGDPVDRVAHFQDPLAATLDHIECQSWVLIPDHSVRNLRTAHRSCNWERGDEGFYTESVRGRVAVMTG